MTVTHAPSYSLLFRFAFSSFIVYAAQEMYTKMHCKIMYDVRPSLSQYMGLGISMPPWKPLSGRGLRG